MRAILTMLASTACFALMSTCVAAAHAGEPGLHTVVASAVRSVVNVAVLVAFARGNVVSLLGDRRPALLLRGVAGAVALVTYFAALARIGAGEAAFLNQTSSAWVAAMAPGFLGERTSPGVWLAVAASALGTAMLGWPREALGSGLGALAGGDAWGRGLGLVSGLSAAVAYLSIRRASASNGPAVIVFYFTGMSTVVCAAWALVAPVAWPVHALTWALLAAAGVFATLGQLWMTRAYQLGPVAPVAATAAATPLLTVILAALTLRQVPDGLATAGMAVLAVSSIALPLLLTRGAAALGPRSPGAAG